MTDSRLWYSPRRTFDGDTYLVYGDTRLTPTSWSQQHQYRPMAWLKLDDDWDDVHQHTRQCSWCQTSVEIIVSGGADDGVWRESGGEWRRVEHA